MKLNEYHDKAMSTNAESSDNIVYSLLGLNAEVGEINDKIAKWRRKGIANIDNNKLVFTTSSEGGGDLSTQRATQGGGRCALVLLTSFSPAWFKP